MIHVIVSTSALARLTRARERLAKYSPAAELVIVGASRGAADDFGRAIARGQRATFGLARFSLLELAARAAVSQFAAAGVRAESPGMTPGTQAGMEAVAARAVFDATSAGDLAYFTPVASTPGFPKALARTLHELRLARIGPSRLALIESRGGAAGAPSAVCRDGVAGADPGSLGVGGPQAVSKASRGGAAAHAIADIGRLLRRVEEQLDRAGVGDRATLFRLAAEACRARQVRWSELPIVLLDVPLDSRAERDFIAELTARSPEVIATVPDGDDRTLEALNGLGCTMEPIGESRGGAAGAPSAVCRDGVAGAGAPSAVCRDGVAGADPGSLEVGPQAVIMEALPENPPDALPMWQGTDLVNLRRYVFTTEHPVEREPAGDVRLFSAPGEGREAVEIVRRALDEAARGVPFDEMAVFLRAPQQYLGLLEHACARGGVPAYFDRGTRRPDPAGRAFVALLSCAVEGLSAKRFDEYLSLGQVPPIAGRKSADRAPATTAPHVVWPLDEAYAGSIPGGNNDPEEESMNFPPGNNDNNDNDDNNDNRDDTDNRDTDDEAVVAGTLRSPWKWEELIVESSVVGGRTRLEGSARWRRRLDGLTADYGYRIAELTKDEPESPRITRYRRDLKNLSHLRAFALPIVDEIAGWPEHANWGEWLGRFTALAPRVLRRPLRVLQTLADLRPMAEVGPVTVEEARDVLHDRLVTLDWEPPARRYGRLFVGTPLQARGRSFRVVFVPGLAERVVPQRPREDPLLLDERRRWLDSGQNGPDQSGLDHPVQLGPALMGQDDRGSAERLLLKVAIGAAGERLYLSYPRLDVAETRARVPSFYALDVMRAITGRIPDHRVLASDAAEEGGASLAWPAPRNPDRAIDDLEHDLAVLKPLLDSRDPARVRGQAHYLLGLNEALRRSVVSRWARDKAAWSVHDGPIRVTPGIQPALESQRLRARPYSPSALQRFATCPYQFFLATIHRLEPWDQPEPLLRMDPLTRGSLFHRAQAEFYRAMQAGGALPVDRERLPIAVQTLAATLDRVAKEYAELLVPAIDRVWRDEIDELRRDLEIWVQRLAEGGQWEPTNFELSFGLSDEGRDPASLPDPVVIEGGFRLRGSVDLVERRTKSGARGADNERLGVGPQAVVKESGPSGAGPGSLGVGPQAVIKDDWRITDHKTGRNRSKPDLIVGGGSVLQPVLYSLALEQGWGRRVVEGRLYYATTVGGFVEAPIAMNDYARGQGLQVLDIIDRAVETGFLAAAPAERACTWCDFRAVCGPREEERTQRKKREPLADLEALRSMR